MNRPIPSILSIRVPFAVRKRGGRKLVITPDGETHRPRPRVDSALVVEIAVGKVTSYALTEADYPIPPLGVEQAAARVRAVRNGYDDRAFSEFRVEIGGYVQVVEKELTLLFLGTTVDVVAAPITTPGASRRPAPRSRR